MENIQKCSHQWYVCDEDEEGKDIIPEVICQFCHEEHPAFIRKNNLRDEFAIAIAPSVVEALSPKGYVQKDWTPAKVIGGTIYAIADAIIAARSKVAQ